MAKITPKRVAAFPSDEIMKEHKRASKVAEVEVAEVKKKRERDKFRKTTRGRAWLDAGDSEFYVLNRRREIAKMYVEGYPQWDIATELGIALSVVTKDLHVIREEWLHKIIENYDARKAMEVARIDRIEEEMWTAWHRSTENAETRTRSVDKALKTKYKKEGDKLVVDGSELIPVKTVNSLVQRGQCGDPRFIERIQWCIEMRCKIFGILKDEKKEVTNVVQINWESIANVSSTAESIESIIQEVENQPVMLQESQAEQE